MNLNIKNFEEIAARGVYCIRNIENGKRYIGSASITISKRIQHHYSALKNNDHKNPHLQNAWNKYGVPNKGQIAKGRIPWNKGQKYDNTNHLKVPKVNKGDNTKRLQSLRDRLPEIYVYTVQNVYIGKWKNTVEITKDSMDKNSVLKLYMNLRNPDGRNGYDAYLLKGVNINKSANYGKPYKGLLFKYRPLHQVTDVDKLDKNGEG